MVCITLYIIPQPGSQQTQVKEELSKPPSSSNASTTPSSQLRPDSGIASLASQESTSTAGGGGGSAGIGKGKGASEPNTNGPQEIRQEPMEVGGKIIKTEANGNMIKTEPETSVAGGKGASAASGSGTKPSNGTSANSKPDMKPPQRPAPSAGASGKQKPRSKKGEFSLLLFYIMHRT